MTAALQARIEALGPWFHDMELKGVRTAPDHFLYGYPAQKWRRFAHAVPDAAGRTVLDIGCNAGFHAFEMKRRGAVRVLGIDADDRYLAQARFGAEVLELDVQFERLSVYDVAALQERFDIVLFLGVLYHLRHPLLALDLIRAHVAHADFVAQCVLRGAPEIASLEEDYDFFDESPFAEPGYPKLHFIERRDSGDPSNWWAPNRACFAAMLRSAGFEILDQPEAEVFVCRAAPIGAEAAVYPTSAP